MMFECDLHAGFMQMVEEEASKTGLNRFFQDNQKNTKIFTPKELFFILGFGLEFKNVKPPERA